MVTASCVGDVIVSARDSVCCVLKYAGFVVVLFGPQPVLQVSQQGQQPFTEARRTGHIASVAGPTLGGVEAAQAILKEGASTERTRWLRGGNFVEC